MTTVINTDAFNLQIEQIPALHKKKKNGQKKGQFKKWREKRKRKPDD